MLLLKKDFKNIKIGKVYVIRIRKDLMKKSKIKEKASKENK